MSTQQLDGTSLSRPLTDAPLLLLARGLLLLLIFSLGFMQPPIPLLGLLAMPSDFAFLALAGVCALLAGAGRLRLRWDPAYAFIAIYLLALLVSIPYSQSVRTSEIKFVTQLYLASLPVIVCMLVRDEAQLRLAVLSWLAASAVVAAAAILGLLLFALDPASAVLDFLSSVKGTLPPGDYPRLQMTFMNPNMACNYLTVSLMLLFGARQVGWLGRSPFLALLAGILVACAVTISPGLGGVALGIGLWGWLYLRAPGLRRLFLSAGIAAAVLFFAATTVTPILHPTAPYLIHVPLLDTTVAPSGRLMIWTDAVRNFLAHPLTGLGIGVEPVQVTYLDPSGVLEDSTDAHNVFLSIAAQCGIVGLAALLLLLAHIARRMLPLRRDLDGLAIIRLAVGLGLVIALVYEGLAGAFEDSRHLWVAFGLLLAADGVARRTPEQRSAS